MGGGFGGGLQQPGPQTAGWAVVTQHCWGGDVKISFTQQRLSAEIVKKMLLLQPQII